METLKTIMLILAVIILILTATIDLHKMRKEEKRKINENSKKLDRKQTYKVKDDYVKNPPIINNNKGPKKVPEGHEQIIEKWINGEITVNQTCEQLGISRNTLYKRFGELKKSRKNNR